MKAAYSKPGHISYNWLWLEHDFYFIASLYTLMGDWLQQNKMLNSGEIL